MKRLSMVLLFTILCGIQSWATSASLTTNAAACPGSTNTTALVVGLAEDKGGATLTVSGTWTGTISFYGTGSGGSLWTALSAVPLGSSTAVTSTTANGTWQVNAAGFTGICMLSSATQTGTANVTITPSAASARSNGGSSGSSGIASINGDTTSAQVIAGGKGTTVSTSAGTTTITPGNDFACSLLSAGSPPWGVCTVSISAVQFLLISSGPTPLQVIPAQGANTLVDVTKSTLEYICSSCTPYTIVAGPQLDFLIGTTDTTAVQQASGFIDQATSQTIGFPGLMSALTGNAGPVASSDLANKAIFLGLSGSGAWTLGTGTFKLTIEYTITQL